MSLKISEIRALYLANEDGEVPVFGMNSYQGMDGEELANAAKWMKSNKANMEAMAKKHGKIIDPKWSQFTYEEIILMEDRGVLIPKEITDWAHSMVDVDTSTYEIDGGVDLENPQSSQEGGVDHSIVSQLRTQAKEHLAAGEEKTEQINQALEDFNPLADEMKRMQEDAKDSKESALNDIKNIVKEWKELNAKSRKGEPLSKEEEKRFEELGRLFQKENSEFKADLNRNLRDYDSIARDLAEIDKLAKSTNDFSTDTLAIGQQLAEYESKYQKKTWGINNNNLASGLLSRIMADAKGRNLAQETITTASQSIEYTEDVQITLNELASVMDISQTLSQPSNEPENAHDQTVAQGDKQEEVAEVETKAATETSEQKETEANTTTVEDAQEVETNVAAVEEVQETETTENVDAAEGAQETEEAEEPLTFEKLREMSTINDEHRAQNESNTKETNKALNEFNSNKEESRSFKDKIFNKQKSELDKFKEIANELAALNKKINKGEDISEKDMKRYGELSQLLGSGLNPSTEQNVKQDRIFRKIEASLNNINQLAVTTKEYAVETSQVGADLSQSAKTFSNTVGNGFNGFNFYVFRIYIDCLIMAAKGDKALEEGNKSEEFGTETQQVTGELASVFDMTIQSTQQADEETNPVPQEEGSVQTDTPASTAKAENNLKEGLEYKDVTDTNEIHEENDSSAPQDIETPESSKESDDGVEDKKENDENEVKSADANIKEGEKETEQTEADTQTVENLGDKAQKDTKEMDKADKSINKQIVLQKAEIKKTEAEILELIEDTETAVAEIEAVATEAMELMASQEGQGSGMGAPVTPSTAQAPAQGGNINAPAQSFSAPSSGSAGGGQDVAAAGQALVARLDKSNNRITANGGRIDNLHNKSQRQSKRLVTTMKVQQKRAQQIAKETEKGSKTAEKINKALTITNYVMTGIKLSGTVVMGVGTAQVTSGTIMVATGTPLLSNPFTAAAGAAMVAGGVALQSTGTATTTTGNILKMVGTYGGLACQIGKIAVAASQGDLMGALMATAAAVMSCVGGLPQVSDAAAAVDTAKEAGMAVVQDTATTAAQEAGATIAPITQNADSMESLIGAAKDETAGMIKGTTEGATISMAEASTGDMVGQMATQVGESAATEMTSEAFLTTVSDQAMKETGKHLMKGLAKAATKETLMNLGSTAMGAAGSMMNKKNEEPTQEKKRFVGYHSNNASAVRKVRKQNNIHRVAAANGARSGGNNSKRGY